MPATAGNVTKDDLDALAVFMADVRDEIAEATHVLASATPRSPAEVLQRLDDLTSLVSRPPAPHPVSRLTWVLLPALACAVGLSIGWVARGTTSAWTLQQARLMGQVDAVLADRYETLPPALRAALQGLYTQAGFQPLGARPKGAPTARKGGEGDAR
jgi:hypothetical protein